MRLKLLHKIFLANVLVIVILALLLLAFSSFRVMNMAQQLNTQLEHKEQYKLSLVTHALSEHYSQHQHWLAFQDTSAWKDFLDPLLALEPHRPPPPRKHGPPPLSFIVPGPLFKDMPKPPLHIQAAFFIDRLALLTQDQQVLIPAKQGDEYILLWPIKQADKTVGWLGLTANHQIQQGQVNILKHELIKALILSIVGASLASIVSYFLAKHIISPIKQLTRAAICLSERKFSTTIPISTQDELADLAGYFNNIGIRLAKYERQQQQWLQDIAHELRTPLTMIRAEIEAMVDGVSPTNAENLNLLQQDVLRLNHLIDDLHELSVTEGLQVDAKPLALQSLCEAAASRIQTTFKHKQLSLHTQLFPCVVYGDTRRLRQVLDNLLENCSKYTETAGVVTLSCQPQAKHAILIIEDSGPGVAEDDLPLLFDRLYRTDSHRNRQFGGAGLGLAICKNIIQAHAGEIHALPATTGGLKIMIRLPMTSQEPQK